MRSRFDVPAMMLASVVLVAAPVQGSAKFAMKSLKITAATGWKGDYNDAIDSWDFYKYSDVKGEATRQPSRLYVDLLPDDAPKTMKEYADKLKTKDFQDITYVYSEITEQKAIDGGFLIRGLQQDYTDKTAKARPNFVVVKKIGGAYVRARGGVFATPETLEEGVAMGKSMSL